MNHMLAIYGAGLAAVAALPKIKRRLELSVAKHPSLAGHSRMAKRVARWLPFYEYDQGTFFSCDGAPAEIVAKRKAGFAALSQQYAQRFAVTAALTGKASEEISDLQFTAHYRVPFQFSRYVREHLKGGSFLRESEGVEVTDLDGNRFYDLTGSYGVNVFGYDFYRQCIAEGNLGAFLLVSPGESPKKTPRPSLQRPRGTEDKAQKLKPVARERGPWGPAFGP